MSGLRTVKIVGTGSYLPERVMTNHDLAKMVDTSDEWIVSRTGISQRHIARDDEYTSDLGTEAAKKALESAGVSAKEVDLIIFATMSPDMLFPNTACLVQNRIGADNAFCMDLEAACSGFLYALDVGKQYVMSGGAETVLVVAAEKLSSVTDWEDRGTCILFGDGAGAVVLKAGEGRGLMSSFMGSDGALADLLKLPAGGSRNPASKETIENRMHYIKMSGNEVFKHAVRCMCDAGEKALAACDMTISDIDCVIPHQANMRIIQAISSRLGNDIDKFHVNLDRTGNMSAASIPVALDEAIRDGRVKPGDLLLFVAFGGGFTWGASVLEL